MRLDWEPLATPKPGYEAEFVDLFHKMLASTGAKREQVMGWFANVSVPPFATIGAPRVGYDDEANAWLRDRLETTGRLAELDRLVIEMHGHCVLELMPPSDGFPVYSNHIVSDVLDRYAFNAALVVELADAIGPELHAQAFAMMLAPAHRDFAARMVDAARGYMRAHSLPVEVSTIREPVFAEGTVARQGHILFAAAKWSTYWSERGHGLAVLR